MGAKVDAWREITKRSWQDPDFKDRLLANPDAVLAEYGVEKVKGVNYRIVLDEPGVRNLVLMQPPGNVSVEEVGTEPLSDENPGF